MKCTACGKKIIRYYFWDGKTYGIECWKRIALPEVERLRQERREAWQIKCRIMIEVMKAKDLSKVKNEFKKSFIGDMIQKFERDGVLTRKQYDLLVEWLNNKDRLLKIDLEKEFGFWDGEDEDYLYHVSLYATGKRRKEAEKALEEIRAAKAERKKEELKQLILSEVERCKGTIFEKWLLKQAENIEVNPHTIKEDIAAIRGIIEGRIPETWGVYKQMMKKVEAV